MNVIAKTNEIPEDQNDPQAGKTCLKVLNHVVTETATRGCPPYLDDPPPSMGLGCESDQLTQLHCIVTRTMCSLYSIINDCP